MRDIDIVHFYRLDSRFHNTEHKLSFFKEIIDEDESYWINAIETSKPKDQHGKIHTYEGSVAIRFTEEELIKLRDSINEILDQR